MALRLHSLTQSISFKSKLHYQSPHTNTNPFLKASILIHLSLYPNFLFFSFLMESLPSTSSSAHHHHHHFGLPLADRIIRALRHHLRLLHRSQSNFFILGATGNVYTVTLTSNPSCTCPDRTTPCKHILFVFIRVLGVPLDDACLRRRSLRPCQLNRLLGTQTVPDALAGASLRRRFHELFFQARQVGDNNIEVEDGTTCPICLDEIEKEEKVVACGTCRNVVHEECLKRWKRSRGRRATNCVICRARWRDRNDPTQDSYLNLAAYVSEDDQTGENDPGLCVG